MTPILPPKLSALLDNGPVLTPAIIAAGTWIDSRATDVLVLQGDTGSGKSLAAGWAFEFAAQRSSRRPLWCSAPDIAALAEWSAEWATFDASPLVVIDDLGTESKPERMTVILERLFNSAAGRAVITTNIDIDSLFARYGRRVESRMRGSATWIPLADTDYRLIPPTGIAAPAPSAPTKRERAAKERATEERRRQAEADEAERQESERLGHEARAELARLTQRFATAPLQESDDERRRVLRDQLDELRRLDAETH